ncbi:MULTISPECIES: multiple stress resistance protein BhsA [Photorhabdus]|uniref:DUF1471 domain-containing protein n=3 Tax=Photorhabdus khanii TaxID=1004150 RepID=A0A4R4K570_9GAMM|nr:DUF1471 domain-containing protein [Photorhabdus khanii]ETS32618.1 Protein of unknown function (DUF1471) [Photorhabdus khanii NC19]MQL49341.1 DUF1471 domain-containing protein [Photorhabdus khanii]OHV58049.1 hypothetical protein BB987_04540 [Photorhabdus temperata]TDB61299.1 DUF1471 domain-containing protein [Photorhabdus khanii subsp. guanajuatensis]
MKNVKYIAVALALSAISFGSMAATEVQTTSSTKVGVVSVTGADTLESLSAELSKKADEAGASSFRIISTSGKNQLSGVAEIYN